jgi:CHAT domain-containing protein/predicted negative regulator of RcsB-dependent stress response
MDWAFTQLQRGGDRMAGPNVDWPRRSSRALPLPEVDYAAAIQEITMLAIFLVIVASAIGNAHAQTAADILAEADRLAWLKNWSRAEPLFSKAEAVFTAAGDDRNALYARISAIRGRLPRLRLMEVSQTLSDYLDNPIVQNDPRLKLRCLVVKGDVDLDLDDGLAQEDWTEALTLAKSLKDPDWEARATGELGIITFLQGDHAGAVMSVGNALSHAIKNGDIGGQIRYLTLIGSGLTEFGRPEQALEYLDRAMKVVASTPDLADPLMTYTERARALAAAGREPEATKLLQSALIAARERQSYGYQADLLIQLARLSLKANRQGIAIDQLQQAFELANKVDARRLISQAALELSNIYRDRGKLDDAEQALASGIEATRNAGDRYTLPRYLAAYAEIKAARRQYRQAADTFQEATDIANGMLSNVSSASAKSSLIGVMNELYVGHFLLTARDLKSAREAFSVIEGARGRSVADLLRLAPTTSAMLARGTSPQHRQISALQLSLQKATSKPERKQIIDKILTVEQSISPAEAANSRKWMRTSEPVAASALRSRLRPDEVFIEFVLAEPTSYCLVATRETLRLNTLPSKAAISRSVEALLQKVRQNDHAIQLATDVYKNILDGVPEIRVKKRLIVVPDSSLAGLPFEVLIAPSGKSLLQSHIVTYAPSGTVLALLREKPAADRRGVSALAVAAGGPERPESVPAQASLKIQRGVYDLDGAELPPLPAAEEEAEAVVSIVGGDSVVLKGAEATESAFKKQPMSRFRILHFAVHGLVSTRYPERSALVFRTDQQGGEDGLLQAREIATLPLRADLVTLSACDTGTGKINGQEGAATLVRPFLVAGAKAVVANLWSADDDFTRTLMKEFYSQLESGLDVGSALTQAKLRVTGRYGKAAPPRLWAGFIVVGDGLRILSNAYEAKH